ncbi:ornithine aminotransferase car2 [Aspergillus lentulus]|nr:ornithine aminotransferase car2 [Aspergillus lentulus]
MTRENQRDGKVVRLSSKTNELLEIDSKHSAGKGSILKVSASFSGPFLQYNVIGEMTESY